ncbi:MAG: hypothetical protein ACLTV6_11035 [Christensenellales bacterium]
MTPLLVAMDKPLGHLPRLDVRRRQSALLRNGNKLTRRNDPAIFSRENRRGCI